MNPVPQTISAYREAFETYYQPLCNFAYQFVKDRDEAEDVVQAVFIKLWKKRHELEIHSKLSSYLFTATKNNALMALRRRQYKSKYEEHVKRSIGDNSYEENVEEGEEQFLLKEKIWKAIQKLPPKCQQIFKLSKISGLTYKEIADDLSISVKTVENQMSKALKILRSQLRNILYLLLLLFLFSKSILAQQQDKLLNHKVKLQIEAGSIQEILDLLNQQSNVPIAYSSNQLSLQKQISLTGQENTLGEYLQQIAEFIPIKIITRKRKILLVNKRKGKNKASNNSQTTTKIPLTSSLQYTLSGYVKDAENGEALIGATIYDAVSKQGTSTNIYGFYSLTLPAQNYDLMISYVGYASGHLQVELNKNTQQNIRLNTNTELDEIIVKASESEHIQELDQMSSNKLYSKKIENLPVLMGEADVIKSVQLLPGVQSVNENASGLYVRGGGPDQNLMLLDGATIYDSNHLFGFVSIFNGDAINSVELIKGGFPARYGGRLSSILDVRLKEGNNQQHHGGVTLGLFSSKLTAEGPFAEEQSSFHVSMRSSLMNNTFAETLVDASEESHVDYGFYDIYAKVNHQFSPNSQLFLSTYFGQDEFYNETIPHITVEDTYGNHHEIQPSWQTGLNWRNELVVLRWNRIFNPQLFTNFSFNYSNYHYEFFNDYTSNLLSYNNQNIDKISLESMSKITDWSFKADFDLYNSSKQHLKWGMGYTRHFFTPGIARFKNHANQEFEFTDEIGLTKIPAHDYYFYFEDNLQLGESLSLNAGLHFAGFASDNAHYTSPQPRVSMRYLLNEQSALKASFARMTQFVHLVNTPWWGMPSDLWIPSTSTLRPKHSNQFAMGYVQRFPQLFDLSVETYYKKFENVLTFRNNPDLWMNGELPDWQQELERGNGQAYGLEFLLERKTGKTTGWIAYTLSRTEQQFDAINNGQRFPYQYDRLHDISLALTQQLTPQISLGLVWIFATGNVATLSMDETSDQLVVGSSNKTITPNGNYNRDLERNNFRLPSYHRLDLSVNWQHSYPNSKRLKGTLKAGFYNLYNRENAAYFNGYRSTQGSGGSNENPNIFGIYEVNLLPRLPFITYSLEI